MANTCIEARLNWRCAGDYAQNVFHFECDHGGVNDFILAQRCAQKLVDVVTPPTWMTRLLALISDETFLSSVSCRVIAPTPGNRYADQFQVDDYPGIYASPMYSNEIAGVCNFISTVEPDVLGRVFIPGVPIAELESGRFKSTYASGVNLFAAAHVNGFTGGGTLFQGVIYRRADESWRPISDGYLSPNVGQMSRRGMGE